MSATTAPRPAPARRPPTSLWRLERLRLWRTHRWLVLVGAYLLFGVVGPLTARYMDLILARVGGGVTIEAPDPRPVDGMIQFVSNAGQLGLLAVVVVAAGALALDADPERAAFLRTRVARAERLVVAPYVVTTLATLGALLVGTAAAWVLTRVLLGPLDVGAMLLGTLLGGVYLAFVVALVAAAAGLVRSQLMTVFASLGALLVLPLLAMVEALRPWMPSELLTAVLALLEGASAGDFVRATLSSVVATAGLLALCARRTARREL